MKPEKYTPPLDPELAKRVDALDDDGKEFFNERSAIVEHDGEIPRAQAEQFAWIETLLYLKQRSTPQ